MSSASNSRDEKSVRILHVSDTHLGYRQYRSDTRREDFAAAFGEAIEIAVDRDVDAVIHTGDLFHRRNPPTTVLMDCIRHFQSLEDADIPFYGIVGNHERKQEVQLLDILGEASSSVSRLDTDPTVVGDSVAFYGVDAIPKPAWNQHNFTLTEPPADTFSILCMHQLFEPLLPEIQAEYSISEVFERLNILPDAVALGDEHQATATRVDGRQVWHAGSTEKTAADQTGQRTVELCTITDGSLSRRQIPLSTREFTHVSIEFGEGDGTSHIQDVLARTEFAGDVVHITLTGAPTPTSSREVRDIALRQQAAVCQVDDQRGRPDVDVSDSPSGDLESIDGRIESRISDAEVAEITADVERDLRERLPSTNNLDNDVRAELRTTLNHTHPVLDDDSADAPSQEVSK